MLLAYLRLLRLPTVFTAMADIALGHALTHGQWAPETSFWLLLASSSALYLAGMVFNDVCDVKQDRVERPSRPIPSGAISVGMALTFGCILMLAGTLIAARTGTPSLYVAILLSLAILTYDGVLKPTPLGPIVMGSCRFLNVMLGASDGLPFEELWRTPQLAIAGGLGLYIVGVTWFARSEARTSSAGQLIPALVTMNLGMASLMLAVWQLLPEATRQPSLLLMGFIAASLNYRAIPVLRDPSPPQVQAIVKLSLLNYVTLCAALVFAVTGNGTFALGTALLVVPAILLGRAIAMT